MARYLQRWLPVLDILNTAVKDADTDLDNSVVTYVIDPPQSEM